MREDEKGEEEKGKKRKRERASELRGKVASWC